VAAEAGATAISDAATASAAAAVRGRNRFIYRSWNGGLYTASVRAAGVPKVNAT
jgi:hypothetical protein